MIHSYTSTESWTYTTYNEFRPSMSLFWPNYYTCSILWILCWCCGNTALFYWFQGQNCLGDDQNLKIVRKVYLKGGESNIKGGAFFSFLSIKTFVTFCFCFNRYLATLKEGSLGKSLMAALLIWILWLRY